MEFPTSPTVNIEEEMRQSYMDYAMSVIIGRALPDVRDGLKPVQRRVLYAMLSEGLTSNKKTSKCAGVVGEVLKRFHPHGDSSVYEALVRLAQPWNLRYPLVDGQGNFGSIDGDPAAAYRYTECRMTALAEKLLEDIERDTVDFIPNFDGSTMEPVVLPSLVPNLLVNGADGIAVGMATHIPPHNLSEVIDGLAAIIENPDISISELMELIPGPDFPTGGVILGKNFITQAYTHGKGILQLRGKTSIEKIKSGSREVDAIVINEIPFQVNKSRLVEKLAELANEKTIEGIGNIRDETDRKGMRVVVELKRDATPEIVLNQIFKLTPLQVSFGIINLAIVEGRPVVCSLKEMLSHFVDHRRDVVTRRTQFDLRKAQERMHILEGFRIALANLDALIQLIKSSATPAEARERLCVTHSLSEIQAQAILDLRLQKLTSLERQSIQDEYEALAKEIEILKAILADSKRVDALIVAELKQLKEQFGDPRRTEISEEVASIDVEDMIEDEEAVVSVTHNGYIKRTPLTVYRAQKRGGKGITGASQKDDDFVEHLFIASTLSDLLVFTNLGRLYWVKVYQIPETSRTARGRALVNLFQLREEESVTAILPVKEFTGDRFVVMATRRGIIKKVDLMEFSRSRRSGIYACTLDEEDTLIGVGISSGKDEIILASKSGMSIRFSEDTVRPMGRTARGVRSMKLRPEDLVVSMTIVTSKINGKAEGEATDTSTLLTVCENGFGKRSLLADYRVQNRGGIGVIDIRTKDRNGPVVGACAVDEESQFMLITSSGKVIRFRAKGVSVIGRNTRGVKLINLDPGEKVVAVAHLMESGSDGEDGE